MNKRQLIVEGQTETADISSTSTLSEPLAALKAEWADAVEREGYARQAIVNLANQIDELKACIADARLRAAAPIPISSGVQGIAEFSMKKRAAQDEVDALQDAKSELLKQLALMESEFRGFSFEKQGIRESMFRVFWNDLLHKHKPLFARIAALGMQLGLTEQMIVGELFYGCDDNLTDIIHEMGINQ